MYITVSTVTACYTLSTASICLEQENLVVAVMAVAAVAALAALVVLAVAQVDLLLEAAASAAVAEDSKKRIKNSFFMVFS